MDQQQAAACVDELFGSWYGHLMRYVARMAGDPMAAEEVVQDTFMDLYRALRNGQRIEFPKAWTLCVARRKAAQRREDPMNQAGSRVPLEELANTLVTGNADLDRAVEGARIRGRFDLLTTREEEVLLLRLESLKYREIASELGISINSVNTLLARALEKLQRSAGTHQARGQTRRRGGGDA